MFIWASCLKWISMYWKILSMLMAWCFGIRSSTAKCRLTTKYIHVCGCLWVYITTILPLFLLRLKYIQIRYYVSCILIRVYACTFLVMEYAYLFWRHTFNIRYSSVRKSIFFSIILRSVKAKSTGKRMACQHLIPPTVINFKIHGTCLTHLPLDKVATTSQTIFSVTFS